MISHAVYDSAISADHLALITNMKPSPHMTMKSKGKRLRTNRLKDPKIAHQFHVEIKKELDQLSIEDMDIDQLYQHFTSSLRSAGLRILGETQGRIKPSLTTALYSMLRQARERRSEMLKLPRGQMKEMARK